MAITSIDILTVRTTDGKEAIHVIKRTDGFFCLRRSWTSYDHEEGLEFTNEGKPDMGAIYDSVKSAEREAKAIIKRLNDEIAALRSSSSEVTP